MEPGVVVGYDQTPSSERAIDEAAAEAASRGVGLTVVHASHHGLAASMHHEPLPHAESSSPYTGRDVAEQGAERARGENPGCPSVRCLSPVQSRPRWPAFRPTQTCWSSGIAGTAGSPACGSVRWRCAR